MHERRYSHSISANCADSIIYSNNFVKHIISIGVHDKQLHALAALWSLLTGMHSHYHNNFYNFQSCKFSIEWGVVPADNARKWDCRNVKI